MPLSQDFKMPEQEDKKEFELLPDDVYRATVKDVEQIVSKFPNEDGSERQVLKFTFELTDHEGRYQWAEVFPSAYIGKTGPTKLLQIINAVRGVDLTQEEARNIDAETINDLVGRSLRLTITHKTSQANNVYNRISSFMASKESKDEIPSLEVEF